MDTAIVNDVMENLNGGIIWFDAGGRLHDMNGYARKLIPGEVKTLDDFRTFAAGRTGETGRASPGDDIDNSIINIAGSSILVRYGLMKGQGVAILLTDISSARHHNTQFHQAQKLEALEQLSVAAAHDFNNLLSMISGYGRIALKSAAPGSKTAIYIERIMDSVRRGSGLTRQLLTFGCHKGTIDPAQLESAHEEISAAGREDLKGKRVLIVEDQDEARAMMRDMLGDLGISRVMEAANGQEALTLLSQAAEFVNVVICDWNMPGMSGLEFLRELRARNGIVPFLMVTGRNDKESVLQARKAGVSGYIRKPFSPAQLEAKLRALLKRSEEA